MLTDICLLLTGFIMIVFSADELVKSSAYLAKTFKISPLVIGLTIVAFGTSAPEIIVTITAAFSNKSGLAIGNAIGSNIANIGLVLGLTALIKPIQIQSTTLIRELPILFVIMMACYLLLADGFFSIHDGLLLLIGLALLLAFIVSIAKQGDEVINAEIEQEANKKCQYPYIRLLLSLMLLPLSAKLIVYSAANLALKLGLSEVTIGLTIIAIGTSLPEVVTSLVGIIKGEEDIAVGNIIGSNMFNLLAVLPFAGLIAPTHVPPQINNRDIPIMLLFSITVILFAYFSKNTIGRLCGGLMLVAYSSYLWLLI